MTTLAIYVAAAIAEIAGCFALWAVARSALRRCGSSRGREPVLFGWLLTQVDVEFAGRAYAVYGGIYIATSLAWLWAVEGRMPDRWDVLGAADLHRRRARHPLRAARRVSSQAAQVLSSRGWSPGSSHLRDNRSLTSAGSWRPSAGTTIHLEAAMANAHRGEIEAVLDGKTFRLCLTLGALAELEAAFGDEDMLALAPRFEGGRLSARDCRAHHRRRPARRRLRDRRRGGARACAPRAARPATSTSWRGCCAPRSASETRKGADASAGSRR